MQDMLTIRVSANLLRGSRWDGLMPPSFTEISQSSTLRYAQCMRIKSPWWAPSSPAPSSFLSSVQTSSNAILFHFSFSLSTTST